MTCVDFFMGDRVPGVHGDHAMPGKCVLWGRVSALIRGGLPLFPLALDRRAIFCMCYRLLGFWGLSCVARSFYGRSNINV